ncbi:MAG: excinuclease ABC subunit UvrA, partial [Bacteroidota bacterium]
LVPKMQVDRYVIHDIELVVDRLQVTDDLKARLSQSVQQTLKLGKDLMFVAASPNPSAGGALETSKKIKSLSLSETENPPAGDKGALYSKLLMCEDTGISYEEPSPNAFSFNSPYGACPTCKGLGNVYTINLDLVLPDKNLSVREGGILPLGEERDASVFNQVAEFAKKNKISIDKPLKDLSKPQLDLLLYGDKGISPDLTVDDADESIPHAFTGSYEGIIPMLKRWFISANSTDFLREWVEKYMELAKCTSCDGARLKKESLWFKVNGRNIAELSNMNLDNLAAWFDGIELMLDNRQKAIGKDVLKEIRERLQFLLDVGLSYLSLFRPSKTLSG